MAVTNGYATLAEIKGVLGLPPGDSTDDARIELAINAVSRLIDINCGRRFYQEAAATRVYSGECGEWIQIDDCVSVTTLKTDEDEDGTYEITWASTDYRLWPPNAPVLGEPYTSIHVRPRGVRSFPRGDATVEVVGTFGWPSNSTAVDLVKQAAYIQTPRLFKRKDSTYGVAGASEFGQLVMMTPKLDPDVINLISLLRKQSLGSV